MTSRVLVDSILSGGIVFFSMLSLIMFILGYRHRKALVKAIISAQNSLREHIENHSEALKNALRNTMTADLERRIEDIQQVEKDSLNKLIDLFLDYSPAAVEMTPVLLNTILAAHVDLLQRVDLMKTTVVEAPEPPKMEATVKEDPLEAEFQYKALIEQLRYEKQDFATKYKESAELLTEIYNQYKEKLELDKVESLKNLKTTEIAALFKIVPAEKAPE